MLAAATSGCSGDQPAPKPQPQPTQVAPAPEPKPEPVPEPEPEPAPEPTASASAEVAEPAPKKPSGRPAILMGPTTEISSTFGLTPGSILKLKGKRGTIVLKMAEYALREPANLTWKLLNKRVKTNSRILGSLVILEIARPGKPVPRAFQSGDTQFEVRWPLGKEMSVNLAVGTADDAKSKKVSWQVIAPTKVETGFKEAYFSLSSLGPVQYFHATLAEPSEAP